MANLILFKMPPRQKSSFGQLVDAIPSDRVKGQYVLRRMESAKSYVDYAELAKTYGQYITLDDQKERSRAVSIKLLDTKPGGTAIPFSFEDVNGNEISLTYGPLGVVPARQRNHIGKNS